MALQSKSKITYITRFLLTAMLLIVVSVGAAAQDTNTFPGSGNAGIGTTTFDSGTSGLQIRPASRSKFGVLLTDTDGSRAGGLYIDSDGFGQLYLFDSGGTTRVHIAASSQDHTYFNSGGNVGIGTSSPNQKLSVVGTGAFYNSTPVTPSGVRGLFMGNYSVGSSIWSYNYATGQGDPLFITGQDINLSTYVSGNGINRLHVSNSGHIGIGTTNPVFDVNTTRYLALDGGGNFGSVGVGANITNTSNPVGQYAFFNTAQTGSEKRVATIVGLNDGATNNGRLDFWTAAAGNFTAPRMSIFSNGNVGIGTTTPGNYKLSVNGPLSGLATFTSYVADGLYGATAVPARISTHSFNGGILFGYEDLGLGDYSPRVGFQQTNHATYSPNITSTQASIGLVRNGNITIKGGASNTEFLRIDNSGNVGIGLSPNYKLDVNGELNATGLRINGTPISVSGAQWTGSSSIYYNGGNVGIGATTPGAKLDIGVGSAARGSFSDVLIGTGGNNAQMEFYGPTKSSAITHDETLGGLVLYTNGPSFSPSMFLANGGNVGIGTTAPQSNLQIGSQTSGATGTPTTLSLGASYSSAAGANLKLKLYDDGVIGNTYGIGVSSGSMDFGVHSTAGYKWYAGGTNKMTLTSAGDLSVSGTINAKYQDLAEWVPSSEQLASGTVVVLDTTKSNQVVSSTASYDTRVAGVISTQPGITLGESGEGKVLVATTGRVRVKVDASRGPIQIGDLLVTSEVAGVAMKSEPVEFAGRKMHMPGTIIGKALEPLAKGKGEILVLLSLQ